MPAVVTEERICPECGGSGFTPIDLSHYTRLSLGGRVILKARDTSACNTCKGEGVVPLKTETPGV
jgi:DnaJ-class molecular chaperone